MEESALRGGGGGGWGRVRSVRSSTYVPIRYWYVRGYGGGVPAGQEHIYLYPSARTRAYYLTVCLHVSYFMILFWWFEQDGMVRTYVCSKANPSCPPALLPPPSSTHPSLSLSTAHCPEIFYYECMSVRTYYHNFTTTTTTTTRRVRSGALPLPELLVLAVVVHVAAVSSTRKEKNLSCGLMSRGPVLLSRNITAHPSVPCAL